MPPVEKPSAGLNKEGLPIPPAAPSLPKSSVQPFFDYLKNMESSPKWAALKPEQQEKIRESVYDKHLVPYFKKAGVEPPSKEYFVKRIAPKPVVKAGVQTNVIADDLTIGAGRFLAGLAEAGRFEHYVVSMKFLDPLVDKNPDTRDKPSPFMQARYGMTEKILKDHRESAEATNKVVEQKLNQIQAFGEGIASDHYTGGAKQWIISHGAQLAGESPMYLASGRGVKAAEGVAEIAPFTKALMKSGVGKWAIGSSVAAAEGYGLAKTQGKTTEEAVQDAALFFAANSILGHGIPAIFKKGTEYAQNLSGAIVRMRSKLFGTIGKGGVENITNTAVQTLDKPEIVKYLDPFTKKLVQANADALNDMADAHFNRPFNMLNKEEQRVVFERLQEFDATAIETVVQNNPELVQHNVDGKFKQELDSHPELKGEFEVWQKIDKETGGGKTPLTVETVNEIIDGNKSKHDLSAEEKAQSIIADKTTKDKLAGAYKTEQDGVARQITRGSVLPKMDLMSKWPPSRYEDPIAKISVNLTFEGSTRNQALFSLLKADKETGIKTLAWLKDTYYPEKSFAEIVELAGKVLAHVKDIAEKWHADGKGADTLTVFRSFNPESSEKLASDVKPKAVKGSKLTLEDKISKDLKVSLEMVKQQIIKEKHFVFAMDKILAPHSDLHMLIHMRETANAMRQRDTVIQQLVMLIEAKAMTKEEAWEKFGKTMPKYWNISRTKFDRLLDNPETTKKILIKGKEPFKDLPEKLAKAQKEHTKEEVPELFFQDVPEPTK